MDTDDIMTGKAEAATSPEPNEGRANADDSPEPVYAVVEIFGRRRHAGRIQEVEQFGAKMLRVDVPKDGNFEAGYISHFYGGASIFSITHTDLASVQRANRPYDWHRPGQQSLPAPDDEFSDETEDDDQGDLL